MHYCTGAVLCGLGCGFRASSPKGPKALTLHSYTTLEPCTLNLKNLLKP